MKAKAAILLERVTSMSQMLHDRFPVATIAGRVEVTALLSILYADSGPSPIFVEGRSLCCSLIKELETPTRFGGTAFPYYRGRAKLTGHYYETGWDTFPVVLFDINAYTFVDDDTKVEVNVNHPIADKIEMDLFYNDGNTQVVRLPGETNPAITIDLEMLFTLHKLINRLPVPTEADSSSLGPPAKRLQARINHLFDKFKYGLERHGLWGDPPDDPTTSK